MSSAAVGGSGILSTLPAYQAAGSMTSARMTKPTTPTRQPKPSFSTWPIGADSIAPSEPAAETMPSTVLRTGAGTARAATDMASAGAVQASDAPISMPAPIMIGTMPCAVAIRTRPEHVQQRAADHQRAKAVAHRHRAGDRLQEIPRPGSARRSPA